LKQVLKKVLRKTFDPIAFKLGYARKTFNRSDFGNDNYDKNFLLNRFFKTLKSIDFYPKHIVDIGANHGTWTRQALTEFPDSKYTLLEPQYWMRSSVADLLASNSNISFHGVGAGKQSGVFKFTIADRDDSCSFMYTTEEAKEHGFTQIEVPIVTLNQLIEEQNLCIPDIIKIDAEGLDIDVLEGATNFFGRTEVFMVEAGVANKAFSNSLLQVATYMDSKGYRLFEITDLNRPFLPAVLWLVELVFVKKDGIIDSFKVEIK
jgi:FkbM family methyltransferase